MNKILFFFEKEPKLLEIKLGCTVGELKIAVEKKVNIPKSRLRVIFHGNYMFDDTTRLPSKISYEFELMILDVLLDLNFVGIFIERCLKKMKFVVVKNQNDLIKDLNQSCKLLLLHRSLNSYDSEDYTFLKKPSKPVLSDFSSFIERYNASACWIFTPNFSLKSNFGRETQKFCYGLSFNHSLDSVYGKLVNYFQSNFVFDKLMWLIQSFQKIDEKEISINLKKMEMEKIVEDSSCLDSFVKFNINIKQEVIAVDFCLKNCNEKLWKSFVKGFFVDPITIEIVTLYDIFNYIYSGNFQDSFFFEELLTLFRSYKNEKVKKFLVFLDEYDDVNENFIGKSVFKNGFLNFVKNMQNSSPCELLSVFSRHQRIYERSFKGDDFIEEYYSFINFFKSFFTDFNWKCFLIQEKKKYEKTNTNEKLFLKKELFVDKIMCEYKKLVYPYYNANLFQNALNNNEKWYPSIELNPVFPRITLLIRFNADKTKVNLLESWKMLKNNKEKMNVVMVCLSKENNFDLYVQVETRKVDMENFKKITEFIYLKFFCKFEILAKIIDVRLYSSNLYFKGKHFVYETGKAIFGNIKDNVNGYFPCVVRGVSYSNFSNKVQLKKFNRKLKRFSIELQMNQERSKLQQERILKAIQTSKPRLENFVHCLVPGETYCNRDS